MTLLERFFLLTDLLFPVKTSRSEREKLYHDLAKLSPDLHNISLIGMGGYLDTPSLFPNGAAITNMDEEADVLLLDIAPYKAASYIERTGALPSLLVVPIAFQERYAERPFYSSLVTSLEVRGYSLFNLYNVERKRGQIQRAYGLFIDQASREAFIRRIAV